MKQALDARRMTAEIRWGKDPGAVVWVGRRSLHQYWPLLAPYFRDVLLPPHRHDEDECVAWSWQADSDGRPPSARELAGLRRRLASDQEAFADNLERNAAVEKTGGELVAAMADFLAQLVAKPDGEFAAFVCRTESGLRIHSWGAHRAAPPVDQEKHGVEVAGQVFVGARPAARVVLRLISAAGPDVAGANSDDNGRFSFSGVSRGEYRVEPRASGVRFTAPPAVVVDHEPITGLEIHGEPTAPTTEPPLVSRAWVRRGILALMVVGALMFVAIRWWRFQPSAGEKMHRVSSGLENATPALHGRGAPTLRHDDVRRPEDTVVRAGPLAVTRANEAGQRAAFSDLPGEASAQSASSHSIPAGGAGPAADTSVALAAAVTAPQSAISRRPVPVAVDPSLPPETRGGPSGTGAPPAERSARDQAAGATGAAPRADAGSVEASQTGAVPAPSAGSIGAVERDRAGAGATESELGQRLPESTITRSTDRPGEQRVSAAPSSRSTARHDEERPQDASALEPVADTPLPVAVNRPRRQVFDRASGLTSTRLHVSAPALQLMGEVIIPTGPVRQGAAESLEALVAKTRHELRARMPAFLRTASVRTEIVAELPATSSAWRWQPRGSSAGNFPRIMANRAEISWRAPNWSSGGEGVIVAANGEPALRIAGVTSNDVRLEASPVTKIWIRVAVRVGLAESSGAGAVAPCEWLFVDDRPLPAAWARSLSSTPCEYAVDVPLNAIAGTVRLALCDPATGWSLALEITNDPAAGAEPAPRDGSVAVTPARR